MPSTMSTRIGVASGPIASATRSHYEPSTYPAVMSAAFHRRALPEDIAVDAFIEKPFAIDAFLSTVAAQTPDGDGAAHRRRMSRN